MTNPDLMHEFPAAAEAQVTLANWRTAPFNKWAFHHVRELVPSADIANDPERINHLPAAPIDFSDFALEAKGASLGLEAFLSATDTDGIVILHKGKIAFESYANGMDANTPHILMSVSKSILGLLAGILVERGDLVLDQPVTSLIPEVAKTAYAGATLRDMLDMRVGVQFEENYAAHSGPIIDYRKAQNWDPLDIGETPTDLRRFFGSLVETDGRHNDKFHYVSPNTDLLGWVIERASGKRYADLVSDLLWRPMGASHSAYITLDRLGAPRCAGGFCATTRDLACLGQLIAQDGQRDGAQIVPASWIKDIFEGGDAAAWDAGDFAEFFPDQPIHYRNKCYVLKGQAPMMFGVGVFGQNLFIDPTNEIVIAKFSSQRGALDHEVIDLTMRAVAALRKFIC